MRRRTFPAVALGLVALMVAGVILLTYEDERTGQRTLLASILTELGLVEDGEADDLARRMEAVEDLMADDETLGDLLDSLATTDPLELLGSSADGESREGAVASLTETARELVSRGRSEDGLLRFSRSHEPVGFDEALKGVLDDYRARGYEVGLAGYLDLLGGAWCCVTRGPDDVEVCLVSDKGAGSGDAAGAETLVEVLTLDRRTWKESDLVRDIRDATS